MEACVLQGFALTEAFQDYAGMESVRWNFSVSYFSSAIKLDFVFIDLKLTMICLFLSSSQKEEVEVQPEVDCSKHQKGQQ